MAAKKWLWINGTDNVVIMRKEDKDKGYLVDDQGVDTFLRLLEALRTDRGRYGHHGFSTAQCSIEQCLCAPGEIPFDPALHIQRLGRQHVTVF